RRRSRILRRIRHRAALFPQGRMPRGSLEPVVCPDGRVRAYRIHGLRKAACVALAYAQCTGPEIMAVSGHSNLAQVQVYIEEAERGRMADAAIEKVRART
ncbi:MAG: hypothetical protein WA801_13935, partial [Pseudolabrys sp.]